MKIELREYVETKSNKNSNVNLKENYSSIEPVSKKSIMQDIEGIHAGPTRNFTWYTKEALKSSIPSWTQPYQKPLIMHHNEEDGKIIGRVVRAEYKENNTRSGTPAIVFTCNVPDKEGKEQILDGRLKTTSIGVTALDAHCSICGHPLQIDPGTGECVCGHIKGQKYGGNICYWTITRMEAKELSYVIVPSDKFAHNLRTYYPDGKSIETQESLNNNTEINLKEGEINNMSFSKIVKNNDLQEGAIINEANGQAVPTEDDGTVLSSEATQTQNETNTQQEEVKTEEEVKENKELTMEELQKEVANLQNEIETYKNTLKDTKKLLVAAQGKIDELTNEVKEEKQLRENAENDLLETKSEFRESLEANVNSFREMLNKQPLSKEVLATRATTSLKDSILDLKEELKSSNARIDLKEAKDPTLKNEFDNFEKNNKSNCVKENKTDSNINMTESCKNEDVFEFLKNFAK